ncbi:MAG: Major ferric iron-binding protein [Candidatus Dichloromethanomonas elyunquensis]|nr:MAG: Major ferric iron-binding protein [Candidatus Dichloromethanomonas elyunquensis]
MLKKVGLFLLMLCFILSTGCSSSKQVVIYTSVDQVVAEPILKDFEKTTGIQVRAVYDVESTKTTGLVNRLLTEKNRPQADVFWSSEFVQTLLLKNEGLLTTYSSPSAQSIPPIYKDPEGFWTAFAGRARVILVNTDLLTPDQYPESVLDFADPVKASNHYGLAYPLFGTTLNQAAALYAYLGPEKARSFFENVNKLGVRVVDGNSVVRDMVAEGQLAAGLTDTDDAWDAVEKGKPVKIIFPDQDSMGTLVIPDTIALIKGGPNPDTGKQLLDYLLSPQVEKNMVEIGFSQIPVHPVAEQKMELPAGGVKNMPVTFQEIYNQLNLSSKELKEIFVR